VHKISKYLIVLFLADAMRSPFANGATPATAPAATQPADPDALSAEHAAVETKLEKHMDRLRFTAARWALPEIERCFSPNSAWV
jgi:hypothetical protein